MIKQVIVMRSDLKMRRGKELAQAAHASMMFLTEQIKLQLKREASGVRAAVFTDYSTAMVEVSHDVKWWIENGFKKVGCRVRSEEELMAVYEAARASGLPVFLVEDEGLTEFAGILTKTCIAVGPAHEDAVDSVTGHLELY
jgi:PTH2 family peptidyl-tRNA hydrolase